LHAMARQVLGLDDRRGIELHIELLLLGRREQSQDRVPHGLNLK
jgi:hypothetical protein